LADFYEIQHGNALQLFKTHWQLKFQDLKKSKMADICHLENKQVLKVI